jgi:CTD small phosphatase-like protein 2
MRSPRTLPRTRDPPTVSSNATTPDRKPAPAPPTDTYETPEKDELQPQSQRILSPKPPSKVRPTQPLAPKDWAEPLGTVQDDLREEHWRVNPFRQDCPPVEEEELRQYTEVDAFWDVSVRHKVYDLQAVPALPTVAPSLRNAFRFLSFNQCPDGYSPGAVEGGETPVEPFLPAPEVLPHLTVVFDLDETLMHCQKKALHLVPGQPDMTLHFTDSGTTGHVRFRPCVTRVLEVLKQWEVEVVVFTASTQGYADAVLNVLDPDRTYIKHRLYRQHCIRSNGGYFKDLRTLGRPMKSTLLVDNSPVSVAMNPDNGVLIRSWHADRNDTELFDLLTIVYEAMKHGDVQDYLSQRYGLRAFMEDLLTT